MTRILWQIEYEEVGERQVPKRASIERVHLRPFIMGDDGKTRPATLKEGLRVLSCTCEVDEAQAERSGDAERYRMRHLMASIAAVALEAMVAQRLAQPVSE